MRRSLLRNTGRAFRKLGLTRRWGQLAIAQVALLSVLLLNWPSTSSSPVVTLTMVVPSSEAAYWEKVIQTFEVGQDEIRIDLIDLAELTPQKDVTRALKETCTQSSERVCDIVYLDVIWVPELAANGALQRLGNLLSSESESEFIDSEIAAGEYQGELYRIPFRADFGMLYYQSDLVDQTALPQTFDELLQTAPALQLEAGMPWGYLWQAEGEGLTATFAEVLQGYGGYWIDPTTNAVGLDEPAAVEAVRFLLRTIELGISPPLEQVAYTDEEAGVAFERREAVFMRNWPFVLHSPGDPMSPASAPIKRVPMALHAEGHTGRSCRGSWGLGIAQRSRHPQQAWRAIQYLTSEATQLKFVSETSYIPSRKELLRNKTEAIAEAARQAMMRPQIADYGTASQILQRYLASALRNEADPETAMKAAAEETRALLARRGAV
ncbi:MAG: extracellular solute-binding protein [Elainellaceae cyanobacterium]